jgi:branched-chain amino acid transport system permease protein
VSATRPRSHAVIPDRFDFSISIILLAMVVLGGMGNVWGVAIGALILSWVNQTGLAEGGKEVNDILGTEVNFVEKQFLIFGAVLVLMMLFRREGFLPEARTRLVLREQPRTEAEDVGDDMREAVEPELVGYGPGEEEER